MNAQIRNDDLTEALKKLGECVSGTGFGFTSGWLTAQFAWAFYWQNGTIRQLVGRFATLMTKAGWDYQKSDVDKFNWGSVQSDLETLGLQSAMRTATIWAFVFGGAAIYIDVDDVFASPAEPLDPKRVRGINRLVPMSAVELYPVDGNYATAEWFTDRTDPNQRKIHRSRLAIIVAHDVPTGIGYYGAGFLSSTTGWPPSWLEGIYGTFCDWSNAEKDVSKIIKSKSLLYVVLQGLRLATNSDDDESAALLTYIQNINDTLSNDSLLALDAGDKLAEVERATAGLAELVNSKKLTFLSSTGAPQELVLMQAAGNLGDNSGPIQAYNDFVDGMRVDMLTAVVEMVTDIDLQVLRYQAELDGEALEVPSRYTVVWKPVAEQTGAEKAKQRKDEAASRKLDKETGLPLEVIASDQRLGDDYADYETWREEQAELAETAKKARAEAGEGPRVPEGDLESTAAIAKRLGVGPSTIHALRKAGKIEGRKVGARWRYLWSAVWEAVNEDPNAVEEAKEAVEAEAQDRLDAGVLGLSESDHFGSVFGASDAMREIFAVLERATPSDISVLITGETGTGKEGIARGLHGDREGRFAAINCAALPDDGPAVLGAFTAALKHAQGGTLFLDEVADLSEAGQVALLRVLGGDAGARVISATSQDLEWGFRVDLLMRLRGIEVEVPPLRDREGDVLVLAKMFFDQYAIDVGWAVPVDEPFAADAEAAMMIYHWPGNVRELKGAVERGALFASEGVPIGAEHLQLRTGAR